jgi:hypothetical protein
MTVAFTVIYCIFFSIGPGKLLSYIKGNLLSEGLKFI